MDEKTVVAQTIREQLGGNQFVVMIRSKQIKSSFVKSTTTFDKVDHFFDFLGRMAKSFLHQSNIFDREHYLPLSSSDDHALNCDS